MPAIRHCTKCQQRHAAPTGKKCHKVAPAAAAEVGTTLDSILTVAQNIQAEVSSLKERVADLETTTTTACDDEQPEEVSDHVSRDPAELGQQVSTRMSNLHLIHEELDDYDDSENELDGQAAMRRNQPTRRGKRSGCVRTALDIVIRDIAWPHYPVYVGPTRLPAKYDELSTDQFVYGYLHNMARESTTVKANMLRHLQELMQDAMDYSWETARSYHKLLLQQMEKDVLSWSDTDQIQEFRRIHAHRAPLATAAPEQEAATSGKAGKTQYCAAFQKGLCQQPTDHGSTRGFVRHICAHCFKTTRSTFTHPESDCRRKLQQATDAGSKNWEH